MPDWFTFVQDTKASIWGIPEPEDGETFFAAKYFRDHDGELHVRSDWSFDKFVARRNEGIPKTPSPECAGVCATLSEADYLSLLRPMPDVPDTEHLRLHRDLGLPPKVRAVAREGSKPS